MLLHTRLGENTDLSKTNQAFFISARGVIISI